MERSEDCESAAETGEEIWDRCILDLVKKYALIVIAFEIFGGLPQICTPQCPECREIMPFIMQLHSWPMLYMARDPGEGSKGDSGVVCTVTRRDTSRVFLTFELAEIHGMCALRRAHTLGQRRSDADARRYPLGICVSRSIPSPTTVKSK